MRLLLALLVSVNCAGAQDLGPAFEVASIKANLSGPLAPNGFSPRPGGLRATNMSLKQLIQTAFNVKTGMLFGANGWIESGRFDIEAKTAAMSNFDEETVMLRSLLIDRFRLRFHRETRPIKMQVLVLEKGGPKFQSSKDQSQKEQVNIQPAEISGTAISFGYFVTLLNAQLGYPIVDETGLHGKYDLKLKYVRDSPDADGPSVFAALRDLGLRLETRQAPMEVFVIDSAERPREN